MCFGGISSFLLQTPYTHISIFFDKISILISGTSPSYRIEIPRQESVFVPLFWILLSLEPIPTHRRSETVLGALSAILLRIRCAHPLKGEITSPSPGQAPLFSPSHWLFFKLKPNIWYLWVSRRSSSNPQYTYIRIYLKKVGSVQSAIKATWYCY